MRITEVSSGHGYDVSVDPDGDVQFTSGWSSDRGNIWFRPAELVAALREAGVSLGEPEKPAETTPEPSARVRVSWRASAADDTERAHFARLAAERIRRRERERAAREAMQAAINRMYRPRHYRDRDGDVWRQDADGRMRLVMFAHGERANSVAATSADMVRTHFGPLTECPDPYEAYRQRWITDVRAPEPERFRDRRGREWETGPDPERIHPIHINGNKGAGFRRATVERVFGPLEPVNVTPSPSAIVRRLRDQARRDMDNAQNWRRAR